MPESAASLHLVYHASRARLGRRRLALVTGQSEMVVRTEIERLRDRGLLRIERSGVALTDAGTARFVGLLQPVKQVCELELSSLRLGDVALAALVAVSERSAVWELRDLAVRGGATGLLLLSREAQNWCFAHDQEPIAIRNPQDAAAIDRTCPSVSDEDRLVIAFGPTRGRAGQGLWAVLAEMLSDR